MVYFIILVCGFGLFMLYMLSVVIRLCKDNGKKENQLETEKELDEQRQESKEHDKLSDDDLLDWLRKHGGLILLLAMIAGCKTELKSSECVWYREPTAAQCQSLYGVDRDLFRKCTLNKMDYTEFCKKSATVK